MNSKKLVSIFGLALALVLGVMIFGGRTTRAVAPVCTVGPAGDYTTIQDAVNDTACTTINVSAGTYNESVTVGRPLILNGPNVGVSAFAPRGPEATVNSAGTTFNLTDGQNVTIEYRYAQGQPERLPELAADLVRSKPDVIFALGGDVTPHGCEGDADDPDCLRHESGSGAARPRGKPGKAGR